MTLAEQNEAPISTAAGAALYTGAVLGAGVLVLPGVAFQAAGPSSLAAWGLDAAIGAMLALVFAALAARFPGETGILGFVRAGLGEFMGSLAGWIYFAAAATGQIVVPIVGALYVGAAWHLGTVAILVLAEVLLAAAILLNLRGVRVVGVAQLGLVAAIIAALAVTAALGLTHSDATRITPFWRHGVGGTLHAGTLLFFGFAGWEAVASLSGQFRDGAKGVLTATTLALILVTVLYLGVSSAVVLGLPSRIASSPSALFTIWYSSLGAAPAAAFCLLALVLAVGTTNAFVAGTSRLGDRLVFPGRPAAQVPKAMIWAIGVYAGLGIVLVVGAGLSLAVPIAVSSGMAIVIYILCAVSASRVLRGVLRVMAIAAALATSAMVPFVSGIVPILALIGLAALVLAAKGGFREVALKS